MYQNIIYNIQLIILSHHDIFTLFFFCDQGMTMMVVQQTMAAEAAEVMFNILFVLQLEELPFVEIVNHVHPDHSLSLPYSCLLYCHCDSA